MRLRTPRIDGTLFSFGKRTDGSLGRYLVRRLRTVLFTYGAVASWSTRLQMKRYLPGVTSIVALSCPPMARSAISPGDSTPAPSSSTEPSAFLGRAAAARSVFRTTNSCLYSGPELLTLNVTAPAPMVRTLGLIDHSWSATSTVSPPLAAGVGVPVAATVAAVVVEAIATLVGVVEAVLSSPPQETTAPTTTSARMDSRNFTVISHLLRLICSFGSRVKARLLRLLQLRVSHCRSNRCNPKLAALPLARSPRQALRR